MALAAGMTTAKLKYGNRGHNQVKEKKKECH